MKKELKYEGELDAYDYEGSTTQPTIDGHKLIDEIEAAFGNAPVKVYLGIEPKGDLDRTRVLAEGGTESWTGWVGTDVTPGDPPELYVGGYDLLAKLRQLDGRYIVLVVEEVAS